MVMAVSSWLDLSNLHWKVVFGWSCFVWLSQKLQQLVQDMELRKRLGRAAKQKVESQFSPDRETEIWLDIYHRVLDKHSVN